MPKNTDKYRQQQCSPEELFDVNRILNFHLKQTRDMRECWETQTEFGLFLLLKVFTEEIHESEVEKCFLWMPDY